MFSLNLNSKNSIPLFAGGGGVISDRGTSNLKPEQQGTRKKRVKLVPSVSRLWREFEKQSVVVYSLRAVSRMEALAALCLISVALLLLIIALSTEFWAEGHRILVGQLNVSLFCRSKSRSRSTLLLILTAGPFTPSQGKK